jgi:GTPase SAR1 family protein
MIGDSGVGKTCLVERFVHNRVPNNVVPTVGQEFSQKIIATHEGLEIAIQIWDTGTL